MELKEQNMFYGASPAIFEKAKMLRNNMTDSEKILWQHLKNKGLDGIRFKPQHPIMDFIADFYCHRAKLVIEIDGITHQSYEQQEYDKDRTYEMENFGIKLIRFTNEQIKNDIEFVLEEIKKVLQSALAPKSPKGDYKLHSI